MGYDWKPTASSSATLAGVPASQQPPDQAPAPDPAALEDATVAEVVEEFIAAAGEGRARNRNGRRYRPSALRDLAGILRGHLVPELGDMRLRDVQWEDLQRIVDQLAAGELSLSRIRSVVSAIRALYAYAIERGIVAVSPADGIEIARVEQPLWDEDPYGEDAYASDPYASDTYAQAPPPREPEPASLRDRTRSFADAAGQAWTESRSARQGPAQRRVPRPPRSHDPSERPLPEMVLSVALRVLVIVFIIIALVSLAQSLLLPA